jgi:arabinan endo-1,5-alpha-L-arabinosidase
MASSQPVVAAGEFRKIYDPSTGEQEAWYINDHCFIRGEDSTWHLFGITHAEPAAPLDERNFAHATSPELTAAPWHKQPFALTTDDTQGERHLWAPHIIRHDGIYHMFYCAGGDDNTRYRIHLATSPDLWHWERHAANPLIVDGYDARDPMVLRIGDQWVLYYTATDQPAGGHHVVACRTSADLVTWSERRIVFQDVETGTYGGGTESPFVVRRGPYYYLFIGPRGDYMRDYDRTEVFRSRDPFSWRLDDVVGEIPAHAAEVVRDEDGQWYASRCGWGRGGVYLAPLTWHDGLDDADASL